MRTSDLHSPRLRTLSQRGKARGEHFPLMCLDVIHTSEGIDPIEDFSIRLHETVHAGQYAKTPFGLYTLWSAVEQGRLAASAYRARHPVVTLTGPRDAIAPLDDFASIEETSCQHLRLWKKLELLRWLLDRPKSQTTLAAHSICVTLLGKKLSGSDLDSLEALPNSVWNSFPHDYIQILDHRLPTHHPCPSLSGRPFGAHGLLESSAIAAQLACWSAMPTMVACSEQLYHTGQDLFLKALGNLDDLFCTSGLHDRLSDQKAAFPNHTPIQQLFDLILQNLQRIPEHGRQCDLNTIVQIPRLFCSLVELALSAPIGPAFITINQGLRWHDLHPGWRFVRAIGVMGELLESDGEARLAWLADPECLQDQVCDRLEWPKRAAMGVCLINWVRCSLPRMLQQHTPADVRRLRSRSLHVALGLERTCAWLPRVRLNKALAAPWVAGQERSNKLRSSWPDEWQIQLKLDQSISVYHRTGKCIWEVHQFFPEAPSRFLDDASYKGLLDKLWRPLNLAEAVETEFFHLQVLRMLVFGTGDAAPACHLLDYVCGGECPIRGEVESACERLIDTVWREWIYR